ncbi:response regulator [Lysinibacillus sp. NPDC056220]|uniref:response regulator transcription factor n=1 Tax=Lysinibacillus sp. NPDC056220 TaxID=3398580 RepID=UPI003BF517C9
MLIVEDENDIANIIKDYLSVHQFHSHIVRAAHEAILYLQESAPDFVILDLSLPNCDGIDICRKIREHSNVAILILSARRSVTDKVLGQGFGADDYMTKPFSLSELVAITNALKHTSTGDTITITIYIEYQTLYMLPEEMPFIFERYFRGRQPERESAIKNEGAGLGAIYLSIMKEHHGSIS